MTSLQSSSSDPTHGSAIRNERLFRTCQLSNEVFQSLLNPCCRFERSLLETEQQRKWITSSIRPHHINYNGDCQTLPTIVSPLSSPARSDVNDRREHNWAQNNDGWNPGFYNWIEVSDVKNDKLNDCGWGFSPFQPVIFNRAEQLLPNNDREYDEESDVNLIVQDVIRAVETTGYNASRSSNEQNVSKNSVDRATSRQKYDYARAVNKLKIDHRKNPHRRRLLSYKRWNAKRNRWDEDKSYYLSNGKIICMDKKREESTSQGNHEDVRSDYCNQKQQQNEICISLSRGGRLCIFPNLLGAQHIQKVRKELLESCKFWRSYSIQGTDEPRLHFLAHEDATNDFDHSPQPGYRYAQITMKARPLSALPALHQLSKSLAQWRNIPEKKWNIGVHPVLYRDHKDSMGDHADDDQGETRILCVLLESPPAPRKVVIKVFDKLTRTKTERHRMYCDGDEVIELYLRPGDAYEMDGIRDPNSERELRRRMCVVFRTGQERYFQADTGEERSDLSPKKQRAYIYGHIHELQQGTFYTRRELLKMNAFQLHQRGISGSRESGADAIIISGKRSGDDNFIRLKYVAEWRIGANALFKSFVCQSAIRVFRSQEYLLSHETTMLKTSRKSSSKLYRYDGLYKIVRMIPPIEPLGTYEFFLQQHLFVEGRSQETTLKPSWADKYRSRDLSCCAKLISLGQSRVLPKDCNVNSFNSNGTGSENPTSFDMTFSDTDRWAMNALCSLRDSRQVGSITVDDSALDPRHCDKFPMDCRRASTEVELQTLPPNTRYSDGRRIRIRMYKPPYAKSSKTRKRSKANRMKLASSSYTRLRSTTKASRRTTRSMIRGRGK